MYALHTLFYPPAPLQPAQLVPLLMPSLGNAPHLSCAHTHTLLVLLSLALSTTTLTVG